MTTGSIVALVVVALAFVIALYLWQQEQQRARIARNPLGRIGTGLGEILGGIGGFIS